MDLPKWPAFHLQGDDVDVATTMDFIARTDTFIPYCFGGNDLDFRHWFTHQSGLDAADSESFLCRMEFYSRVRAAIPSVDIDMVPSDNIATCFVDGPQGFVRPDGSVVYRHNVGKWPEFNPFKNALQRIVDTWEVSFEATLYDIEDCELEDLDSSRDTPENHALVTFKSDGRSLTIIEKPQKASDVCFRGIREQREQRSAPFEDCSFERGLSEEQLETHIFPLLRRASAKAKQDLGL